MYTLKYYAEQRFNASRLICYVVGSSSKCHEFLCKNKTYDYQNLEEFIELSTNEMLKSSFKHVDRYIKLCIYFVCIIIIYFKLGIHFYFQENVTKLFASPWGKEGEFKRMKTTDLPS